MNSISNPNFENALVFYESFGLLDTATEIAKRMSNFKIADELYDKAIKTYEGLKRSDITKELEIRKKNLTSTYKITDDFVNV